MTQTDDEVTIKIPLETMRQVIYGEGHAPVGPMRPTRDLRPLQVPNDRFDLSDGVPDPVEHDATTEPHLMSVAS